MNKKKSKIEYQLEFLKKTEIKNIIQKLSTEFIKKGDFYILPEEKTNKPNTSHINNGFCGKFAYILKEKLEKKGIKVEVVELKHNNIPHSFVRIDNKYYDSETPEGISNWKQLPIYYENKKFISKIKNKLRF